MAQDYANTSLWRRTLGQQVTSDMFSSQREHLRVAYIGMRAKAAELVQLIPIDCKGLTVHDITHLDALWETADLICGEDFELNPLESFVFGAAVLIHDAGMSAAAFPGGMNALKSTTEWADAVYAHYRRSGLKEPSVSDVQNPPNEFQEQILFHVLRIVHGKTAQGLIAQTWALPNGEEVRLLEDLDLRTSLGRTIGKIAHSHHWDIERVNSELRDKVGSAPNMPPEWTINEKKVACLLRCADAAHIDHRRAPSMLYALSKPKGNSDLHWRFQHKLNKPTTKLDALLYSTGQDFEIDEAPAWWLCFDTIKMIDKELSSSNALLEDIGSKPLKVSKVYGAESPRLLAQQIRPNNWRPVDAEIRVSNPGHLAKTLGGRNLYGSGGFAPIRELLQNAVDAIRARRKIEGRNDTWGTVRLILETQKNSEGDEYWLHVDDSGVGMSERVLTGPLLDFGSSLWNSALLQEEFPGLESRGIKPIGKYGIGFFSIFMLGEKVKVVSRPFKAGVDSLRALEFSSIDARPILRNAGEKELPTDFSTRVSVRIARLQELSEESAYHVRYDRRASTIHDLMSERIKQLIAAVDIRIEVEDRVSGKSYVHLPNWRSVTAETFLDEIISPRIRERKKFIQAHAYLLSEVTNADGRCVGRAALQMISNEDYRRSEASFISVGGFVYPGYNEFSYLGVLEGDTNQVTRNAAIPLVPKDRIADWASRQAKQIDSKRYTIYDLLIACHKILNLGGDPQQLPFCFADAKFVSLHEFEALISGVDRIHIPINKKYDDNFQFIQLHDLGTTYFAHKPLREVVSIQVSTGDDLFPKEIGRKIVAAGSLDVASEDILENAIRGEFSLIIARLENAWQVRPKFRAELTQIFDDSMFNPPSRRWVLTLQK